MFVGWVSATTGSVGHRGTSSTPLAHPDRSSEPSGQVPAGSAGPPTVAESGRSRYPDAVGTPMREYFDRLGSEVDTMWSAVGRRPERLSGIASDVLTEVPVPDCLDATKVARY